MTTLEKVMQMRNQGMSDSQISQSLRQEGVTPKEIDESLSQSKIKMMLEKENRGFPSDIPEPATPEMGMQNSTQQNQGIDSMQKSIMPSDETEESYRETYTSQYPEQQTQEEYPNFSNREIPSSYKPATSPYYDEYQSDQAPQEASPSPYDQSYQQEYYPEYQPQQAVDIETINDIADQIFEEKTEKIKKQISAISSFKDEINPEIEKIKERLEKLEKNFNDLQMAIVGKIGEYGRDIQSISKEMKSTQNSFSKVIDPLVDNIRELKKITGSFRNRDLPEETKEEEEEQENPINNNQNNNNSSQEDSASEGFENYLR
jgi:predicted CopG family antitoxin